jgi:hypothetical protein
MSSIVCVDTQLSDVILTFIDKQTTCDTRVQTYVYFKLNTSNMRILYLYFANKKKEGILTKACTNTCIILVQTIQRVNICFKNDCLK